MKKIPGWTIYAAAAFVVVVRLAAILPLSRSPLILDPVLEDSNYQARVLEIRDGKLLDETLPRGSVLYPYVAAAIPGGTSGLRPLAVVQALLEGGTALFLMLWLRRRWGLTAALAGALLYAIDPLGAVFAARFSPVIPATFLFVLSVWLLDRERTGKTGLRPGVLFGIVCAVGFLLLPLPFLFLLLLRAGILLRSKTEEEKGAGTFVRPWARALLPLVPLLVLSGLILVQHAAMPEGAPLLGWGGGPAVYKAFSPETGGTPRRLSPPSWSNDGTLKSHAWETRRGEGTLEDLYRFYLGQGLQQAVENPVSTIGVVLTKAAGSIGAFPIPDDLSPWFLLRRSAPFFAYGGYTFALLLGLGLSGLLLLRGHGAGRSLAPAFSLGLLAVALSVLFGMASAASRHPALPLLAGLGGIALSRWLGRRREAPGALNEAEAPENSGSSAVPARFLPLVAAGALIVSLGAGLLSPTAALRNPSEDLRLLAAVASESGNLHRAVPMLEEAVRLDPENLDARVLLAQAYQADALSKPAMEQLEAAYRADSTHAGTLYTLAMVSQKRGDAERAIQTMVALVNLHPNNPLYLNELGNLFLVRGLYPQATQLFSRALEIKPDYDVARQNLVTVESYRQRVEESLFPRAQSLPPDDPFVLAIPRLVEAMSASEWSLADSILSAGERDHPGSIEPLWFRAAYHARRGDMGRAVPALERCDALAPGRPMIVQQLAEAYLQTGADSKLPVLFNRSLAAAGADSSRARMIRSMKEQVLGSKP